MPRPVPSFEERRRRAKECCRPGFVRKFLHDRGEPVIYVSDDGTEIIIDNPDGTVEKKPV